MKATINGVALEGTPEEILKYQQLTKEQTRIDNLHKHKGLSKDEINKIVKDIQSKFNVDPIVVGYY
jgi:hypothetical protein